MNEKKILSPLDRCKFLFFDLKEGANGDGEGGWKKAKSGRMTPRKTRGVIKRRRSEDSEVRYRRIAHRYLKVGMP